MKKTVKPFGDRGAHIVVPFKLIGKEVSITWSDSPQNQEQVPEISDN